MPHAAGGKIGSIMVGMFVSLCLASQKPSSEQEFFVPAGTGLGVKLLTNNLLKYYQIGHQKTIICYVYQRNT